MDIKILEIEMVDDQKIRGIATIDIRDFAKVSGIKILQGNHGLYCCCPNQSHTQNGLRKWSNILTFERVLWREIQEKIIKEYEEKERRNGSKKTRGIN